MGLEYAHREAKSELQSVTHVLQTRVLEPLTVIHSQVCVCACRMCCLLTPISYLTGGICVYATQEEELDRKRRLNARLAADLRYLKSKQAAAATRVTCLKNKLHSQRERIAVERLNMEQRLQLLNEQKVAMKSD